MRSFVTRKKLYLYSTEPQVVLKILVRDSVTHQLLSGASVDIYMNHTLTNSTQTGEGGSVLFWMTYSADLSLTLLGNKRGYVPRPLPWSTRKRPGEYRPEPV